MNNEVCPQPGIIRADPDLPVRRRRELSLEGGAEIHPRYAGDIPEMHPRYARDTPEIQSPQVIALHRDFKMDREEYESLLAAREGTTDEWLFACGVGLAEDGKAPKRAVTKRKSAAEEEAAYIRGDDGDIDGIELPGGGAAGVASGALTREEGFGKTAALRGAGTKNVEIGLRSLQLEHSKARYSPRYSPRYERRYR